MRLKNCVSTFPPFPSSEKKHLHSIRSPSCLRICPSKQTLPSIGSPVTGRPAWIFFVHLCRPTARLSKIIDTARRLENCAGRSEEHTSELQSQSNLVCRLL